MGSDFDSLNPWLHGVDSGTNGIYSWLEMIVCLLSSVDTGLVLTDLLITLIVKRKKKY